MPPTGRSTKPWGAEALRLVRAVALSCGVAISLNLGVALADPGGHGKHGNPHSTQAASQDTSSSQNATTGQSASSPATAADSGGPPEATTAQVSAPSQSTPPAHGNGRAYGHAKHAQDHGGSSKSTAPPSSQPGAAGSPGAGAALSSPPAPGPTPTASTPTVAQSPQSPPAAKPTRPAGSRRSHRTPRLVALTGTDAARHAHRPTSAGVRGLGRLPSPRTVAPSSPARHEARGPSPAPVRVAPRRRPESSAPPLLPTLTKIIGVVPLPVRVAMGVLIALALGLGASSRLTALRARRLERQRRQLLEDVGLLQAALLPVVPSRLGQVATSAAYRPADGPAAGGDFYDLFALDDGRIAVILGDLSGHGRRALPHTALVRFTLRAYLESGLSPRTALRSAAAVLDRQLGESFATVIVGIYDPGSRRLVYACAGHSPPLIIGAGSIQALTVCCSPPLGLGPRAGTRQTMVALPGSAVVCFCTDGLAEARTATGRVGFAGLERTLAGLAPDAGAEGLLEAVAVQARECSDDMAACLLRIEGAPAAAVVLAEEIELSCDEAPAERASRFLGACGVPLARIEEFLSASRETLAGAHDVILQVIFGPDGPKPVLSRPDVPVLHPPRARGASRLEVAI